MTWAAYVFLLIFLSTLFELLFDSIGLSLPLIAIVCFYLATSYGLWGGLSCAIIGGCSLDFLLGRETPGSVILLLLVVGLSMIWLYRLEASSPFLLCIPGALLPFIVWTPWSLPAWNPSLVWLSAFFDCLSGSLLASICSTVLLPVAVLTFDYFGQMLELDLFSDAKERLANAK